MIHSRELNDFHEILKKDGIIFQSITWQEVICNLNNNEQREEHIDYLRYLTERYL